MKGEMNIYFENCSIMHNNIIVHHLFFCNKYHYSIFLSNKTEHIHNYFKLDFVFLYFFLFYCPLIQKNILVSKWFEKLLRGQVKSN